MDPNLKNAVDQIGLADVVITQLRNEVNTIQTALNSTQTQLAAVRADLSTAQSSLTAAQAQITLDRAAIDGLTAEVARLQAIIDAGTPVPPPPPPPPPPTTTGLPPLIGSSAPTEVWEPRKQAVEAFGGKYEARRLFMQALSDNPTTLLNACAQQNLVPIVSYKPGTWASVANGSQDAALKVLADRLNAFNKPAYLVFHHEPDQKSDPKNVGEGGSGVDFGRMQAHVADYFHQRCPKVRVGVLMNGWWFTAKNGGFSDSEIEVWLPKSTRDKLDFIGADDYNAEGADEKAIERIKRRVAWMARVGYDGPTAVGETNGWVPTDLTDVFSYAKTSPKFANSFVLVWDSQGTTYQPLSATGMVDDMGKIVRDWRK